MSLYVAAYDIRRDTSRYQVARILLRYGRRVQRSVYEIDLEPEDVVDMKREVGPWLDANDQFDLIPIDTRNPKFRLRWQRPPYEKSVRLF